MSSCRTKVENVVLNTICTAQFSVLQVGSEVIFVKDTADYYYLAHFIGIVQDRSTAMISGLLCAHLVLIQNLNYIEKSSFQILHSL